MSAPALPICENLRHGRVILKSGEYDGGDLMRAWCAMAQAADYIEHLYEAVETLLAEARERGGAVTNGETLGVLAVREARGESPSTQGADNVK